MPKITMTRDWKSRKAGETWNASDKVSEQLISGGFAQAAENAQSLDEERAPEPDSESASNSDSLGAIDSPDQVPSENPLPIPQRHARHRSWIRIH